MAFSADNVVDAIFDEDFSLSDGDESDFEGGDDIHALLGEPVLRRADVMADPYVNEERSETSSEEEQVNITSPHDSFPYVSSLDDTYTEDHCIESITEGERRHSVSDSEIEVRKPKGFSVIGVN